MYLPLKSVWWSNFKVSHIVLNSKKKKKKTKKSPTQYKCIYYVISVDRAYVSIELHISSNRCQKKRKKQIHSLIVHSRRRMEENWNWNFSEGKNQMRNLYSTFRCSTSLQVIYLWFNGIVCRFRSSEQDTLVGNWYYERKRKHTDTL